VKAFPDAALAVIRRR